MDPNISDQATVVDRLEITAPVDQLTQLKAEHDTTLKNHRGNVEANNSAHDAETATIVAPYSLDVWEMTRRQGG